MLVQCVMLYRVSHQCRGARSVSFGKAATPVGNSTRPVASSSLLPKLCQYIRAEEAADPVTQYSITLSSNSSRLSAFSGCPSQAVHDQNFSMIHASCPAGESVSPYPRVCGRVDCCLEYPESHFR